MKNKISQDKSASINQRCIRLLPSELVQDILSVYCYLVSRRWRSTGDLYTANKQIRSTLAILLISDTQFTKLNYEQA